MYRKNRKLILLTGILCLLPTAVGLILWDKLPARMPMHWNMHGEIDGYGSKAFAVFFPGVFLFIMHMFCASVTAMDPDNANISSRLYTLILCICPALGVFISALVYPAALSCPLNVSGFSMIFTGVLFILIGNYLPKCQYNHTVGIRIPWTLWDEEVWNKTHRMAGLVWMICGVWVILGVFTGQGILSALLPALVMILIPSIYAYTEYRKRH